jgi:uncharacterized damage-inducible protein DinB
MITSQYCVTMAQYNSWMNAQMYTLCATLTDEERKRDHRAFFRSIQGTLNHIPAVDLMLLSHFTHGTPTFLPAGDLYENFNELRHRREEVDVAILDWSRSVSVDWLEAPSPYTHHGDSLPRTVTRGFWVVQMFNHQTHHRGQITTVLTQLGHDIGSTDLHMSVPRPEATGA